jgi:peptidoglycan L-alanyl-D-glutamate endopeptidase CwlK
MSAGEDVAVANAAAAAIESFHATTPTADLTLLAPAFRAAVDAAIAECNDGAHQLNAMVYETYRSNELQAVYFTRGRTVRPPQEPVTNAMTSLQSWHGYGLAVDVIHKTKRWGAGDAWFASVADVFKRHGCKWGGDWTHPDRPHFQWGLCKPSPSDQARELIRTSGVFAVWEAVGAL